MKKYAYIIFVLTLTGMVSCKKWLEVPPEDVVLAEDALNTAQDAQRVLNSCYDALGNTFDGDVQNLAELLSDNLTEPLNNLELQAVYGRDVNIFNTTITKIYTDLYQVVFRANTLLARLESISDLSASEKTRIEGECHFLRGFCHWWVLKIWAQPYGYTADNSHLGIVIREEASNLPIPRSTVAQCYTFILNEFNLAHDGLPESNDVYANKYAAAGMLSMVNFQKFDYNNARLFAEEVINSDLYSLEPSLDIFHSRDTNYQFSPNPESIFYIESLRVGNFSDYRNEGFRDQYRPGAAGAQLSFSPELYNMMALDQSDQRFQEWFLSANGQYQSLRFGVNAENTFLFDVPLIRLTVLKLIHAEAVAQTGVNLQMAIDEINEIRDRAFAVGTNHIPSGSTADQIIDFARMEFRKETLCEGLWIDQIRRIGASGETYDVRGAPWNCPGMAISFPNTEYTGADFINNPEGGCN